MSTLSFMPAEPPGGPRRPGGPHPDLADTRADLVRRHPAGAEVVSDGVSFRVWAPACRRVEVVFEGSRDAVDLIAEEGGYFSAVAVGAAAGDLYRLRLDAGDLFPDPASRFQPQGPHGPSCVVDPAAYEWHDAGWRGATLAGQVLYEIHIGSYTPEGTWAAAAARLHELAALGITMLEVMPVAEFPGMFGWGYDGVDLFAPTHLYGSPDDFRRFVDRAHALGLAVILDVVYNHFGPDGNYLERFSPDYFTDLHANDWGKAIHFYGETAVRELFIANAVHWIEEYHLDGLRFDATQDIHDRSDVHILAAIAHAARQAAAALPPGRSIFLVAENEPQDSRLVRPVARGGYGLDAIWTDDFHHSAHVALTGRAEAYFSDYRGTPQELVSAVKHGPLYQGQHYLWQQKRRGSPALGLPRPSFVTYLENHDQVANSARGERLHTLSSPGCYRAMTAVLLLGPATPLLFQGQEFLASSPFVFFADHQPQLAQAVRRGRGEFLAQFPSLRSTQVQAGFPLPEAPATFALCKLDLEERQAHAGALALHRDLLRLRRHDPVFRLQGEGGLDGAVLGPQALVLRFFALPAEAEGGEEGAVGDRLLIVNLGADLDLSPAPEPLLAPPWGLRWQLLWSSEEPAYGGSGAAAPEDERGRWRLVGQSAMVLAAVPADREDLPRKAGGEG